MTSKKKPYGGEYARRAEKALEEASMKSTYRDESRIEIMRLIETARINAQLHHTEVLREMAVPVPVPEGPLQDQPSEVWGSPATSTEDDLSAWT